MAYDGIVTKAVVENLSDKLLGGRIDKVYQQERDELLIYLYNKGYNYKLLISASSNNPRMYLTDTRKENPSQPPMFCMLLRKHLIGGIVLDIKQVHFDRIIIINISGKDDFGNPTEKSLVIEIMGKHSNIILIDKISSTIIDSIKRVYMDMSRVRQILPGSSYVYPPKQDKLNPMEENGKVEFFNQLDKEDKNLPIFKFFYMNYMGFSPLISREICFDANIDIDRTLISLYPEDIEKLYESFSNLVSLVLASKFKPNYILSEDEQSLLAFHALDIEQFGQKNIYLDSISEVLDRAYQSKDSLDRVNQKSNSIKKSIQIKLERTLNKLGKQKQELLESQDREKYKIYGDLLSANLYKVPKGSKSISLENFYDKDLKEIEIPLDNKISPALNAQRFYKKYSKLKNANQLLLLQIPETEDEIDYLENILLSIENSTEVKEIDEIKEELIKENYIKGSIKKKKKKEDPVSKPYHFISSDGINIYVGKNNKQNDYLTLKFAQKNHIWLHVQNMPGSHVIIEEIRENIGEQTLVEAASLAAYYSKGKNSNKVLVDYTERKNVKKPANSKPGMVIYENFSSILVKPSKDLEENTKKI